MQCPVDYEMVVSYAAGALSAAEEAALDQHLETCAECRRVVDAQRAVWSALDAWTPAPVSPDFDQKLYRRIAAEEQAGWRTRILRTWPGAHWSWRPAMPLGAACAALIAVFLLQQPAPQHASPVQSTQKVDIEQVERALDDLDMLKQLGVTEPT
jgi:anti-sigma-K factor RskA